MPKKHANIIILVVSDLFAPGALVNIVTLKILSLLLASFVKPTKCIFYTKK